MGTTVVVVEKTVDQCCFFELKVFDVFRWGKRLFIKTSLDNAMELDHTGVLSRNTIFMSPNDQIMPLVAEITIQITN